MRDRHIRWRRPPEHIPGSRRGIAAIIGGVVAGAGAIGGGALSSSASKSAASTQAAAAQQAAQLQYQMYQQTATRLQPWTTTGTAAQQQVGGLLGLPGYQASGAGGLATGALTQQFQPTMQQLAATPGYQFTEQQGLQAVQNASTAVGQGGGVMPGGNLGVSGPEGKGMANYAENLASTTYQQQFNNYWSQLNNIYNMLSGTSAQGANAAALTGQSGSAAATAAGNALQGAAASSAAGTIGAANAATNALSGVGNAAMNYATIAALQQNQNPTVQNNPANQGGGGGP